MAIPAISRSSVRVRSASAASTNRLYAKRAALSLIRRRQAPHGELDAPVGEFAPAFDLGHVGGLGVAAKHLAGLLARLFARQREGLAPERVAVRASTQRLGGVGCDVGGSSPGAH